MAERPRTAVVTGGTRGIGRAIALRLATAGYNVVLNYASNDARAAETLDACRQITPHALLVKADIGSQAAVAALIGTAVDAFTTIDLLVNNAGIVRDRPALEMTEDEWDQVLTVNLKGAFLCAQHAARQMLRQPDGGQILNIGAFTGIRGRLNGVNMCASKAGLMVMTRCLALELAPRIRVNTVIPGLTYTDETEERFHLGDPATLREREREIPLQRVGQPADIADAVLFLASDQARHITGQQLVINGGQYMW